MKSSILSLLGSTLDAHGPRGKDRWNAWRPNVALAMQEDLHFDEFHLLYQSQFQGLADSVIRDIRTASPDTVVIPEIMEFDDPWDFGEVYGKLYDYALSRRFDREERDWYVHITTGSHVAQICLFLLNESHHLPGKLVQTAPGGKKSQRSCGPRGTYRVIDLELSRYDALARRFATERRDDITSLKGGIATRNAAFNALIETVERVAVRSRDPILLTGPTGAGKSQLARRVYELRKAKGLLKGEFVDVNCATLRGDQATSALFGHRKGAYTCAATDPTGTCAPTSRRGAAEARLASDSSGASADRAASLSCDIAARAAASEHVVRREAARQIVSRFHPCVKRPILVSFSPSLRIPCQARGKTHEEPL